MAKGLKKHTTNLKKNLSKYDNIKIKIIYLNL